MNDLKIEEMQEKVEAVYEMGSLTVKSYEFYKNSITWSAAQIESKLANHQLNAIDKQLNKLLLA